VRVGAWLAKETRAATPGCSGSARAVPVSARGDGLSAEAKRAYKKLCEPHGPQSSAGWHHITAKTVDGLATVTDPASDALGRASHGLERSHWG
jgi:hypothetical protein